MNKDEGEELNHGDSISDAQESTERVGAGNLWVYDEELLRGNDFPCLGLQVVPQKLNHMKMFSVLFVKFKCPSITQDRGMEAVQSGYRVSVDRWLAKNQGQDNTVCVYAERLRELSTTVRSRLNTLLKNASDTWPIIKRNNFSFQTFETPVPGQSSESQETLDCLKAAIIKNAIEHHAKHKAKAPSSCEPLLDAVRPDEVAKFVIDHILVTNESFTDSMRTPEVMIDDVVERMDRIPRRLEFVSSDDELFIPSEDWHEQFPSIESDLHFDDIVCDNLQDFNPWD